MCSLLRTPHTVISRMKQIYQARVDSFPCRLPSHAQSLFWKSQLTKTKLIFAKTWDLPVWWLMLSAQSVQIRAVCTGASFLCPELRKAWTMFSRKCLKNLHRDFIYPALFSCSATVYLHDLGQVTLWLGCRLQWAGYCVPKAMRPGIFLQSGSPALAHNDP